MTTKIYIVEDHPLMRNMLHEVIDKMPGATVCGAAATAEEALDELDDVEADLALIDVSLPKMSGNELLEILRERHPMLCCLVLSGHKESNYVEQAIAAGAWGYVLKGDPRELQEAIEAVLAGKRFVSRQLRTGK